LSPFFFYFSYYSFWKPFVVSFPFFGIFQLFGLFPFTFNFFYPLTLLPFTWNRYQSLLFSSLFLIFIHILMILFYNGYLSLGRYLRNKPVVILSKIAIFGIIPLNCLLLFFIILPSNRENLGLGLLFFGLILLFKVYFIMFGFFILKIRDEIDFGFWIGIFSIIFILKPIALILETIMFFRLGKIYHSNF